MALSDLHSARLENIIRDALRHYRSYHTCYCPECSAERDEDDDEEGCNRYYEFDSNAAAKEIILALKKLEDQFANVA